MLHSMQSLNDKQAMLCMELFALFYHLDFALLICQNQERVHLKYYKAESIFPNELLDEIYKYVQDGMVYIPKPKDSRKKWGENTGSRQIIQKRNEEIRNKFENSVCIENLANEFHLAVDTIKKIVYKK